MIEQRIEVAVVQDSYGRWHYAPRMPADVGSSVARAAVRATGPFDDRRDAIRAAAQEHPEARITCDGLTIGASRPPQFGELRIDRDEERRRAGLRPLDRGTQAPPAATSPVSPPAPAASRTRAPTVSTTRDPAADRPLSVDEPVSYGQGRRFEEEYGAEAGRLGEGALPADAQPEPAVVVPPADPLEAEQARKQAVREAMDRARAGI